MDYAFVAYTEDKRIVKGKISAASEPVATEALARVGYRLVSLKPVTPFLPSWGGFLQPRVKTEEMTLFSRQLALLTDSGVGIVQSLELLAQQSPSRRLKQVLGEVVADLRSGSSISAALAKHPQVFPPLYYRMVTVGEQTGELGVILRSLADYMEREAVATKRLKTALMYPTIILILAVVVVTVLVTVALPPLINLFTQFGTQLPLPTRILLFIVNFVTKYGLYLLFGVVALLVLVFLYIRTATGRYHLDRLILSLPVLGRLNLLTELARNCRSLSLLFRAGLPLPEVMTLTRQASGNRVVAKGLAEVEQDMLKGEGLARPMSKNHLFPPLMVTMTRVGEETGNLDETLMTVAQNYEVEAEDRMRTAIALIEPVMLLLLGGLVAFLALSLFMPLYGVLQSIGAG